MPQPVKQPFIGKQDTLQAAEQSQRRREESHAVDVLVARNSDYILITKPGRPAHARVSRFRGRGQEVGILRDKSCAHRKNSYIR